MLTGADGEEDVETGQRSMRMTVAEAQEDPNSTGRHRVQRCFPNETGV